MHFPKDPRAARPTSWRRKTKWQNKVARLRSWWHFLFTRIDTLKQEDAIEKLSFLAWQVKRLNVFARDGYRCGICSAITPHLEAVPLESFEGIAASTFPEEDLITVCPKCREAHPARLRQEKYLLKSLRLGGFLPVELVVLSSMINVDPVFRNLLKRKIALFSSGTSTSALTKEKP